MLDTPVRQIRTVQQPTWWRDDRGRPRAVVVFTAVTVLMALVHLLVSAAVGVGELEPYGLIHSVPVTLYLSVAACAVGIVVLLKAGREHPWLWGVTVAALVVVLHGTAGVLEGWTRFPTAWLHAGYTESVMSTGEVSPEIGARFSWPAFFTATASVFAGNGATVPEAALRWSSVFFQLAYLAPLHVVARHLCASWRTTWLALVLFAFTNWVGQDYFAPQAWAFLLSLCVLAAALRTLSRPPRLLSLRWPWGNRRAAGAGGSAADHPAEAPAAARGAGAAPAVVVTRRRLNAVPREPTGQIAAVLFITLLAAALAASHQLTPYVLALQLGVLWGIRRLNSWTVPVLVLLMALLWTSWGAVDFWISHLDDMFGSVGEPSSVIHSSVATEAQTSMEHTVVVQLRMLYAGLLGAGALVGMVRLVRRSGGVDLTVPALAVAPVALVFLQDYGGEVLLRVFLYATPFIAILMAHAFIPGTLLNRASTVSLVAILILATPLLLVAKYGNESFERITPADVDLGECLYDAAPPGSEIHSVTPHLAWQFTDVEEHAHVTHNAQEFDTPDVATLAWRLPTGEESFVVASRMQATYVERVLGGPEGWGAEMQRDMAVDDRFVRVCQNEVGSVYRFSGER